MKLQKLILLGGFAGVGKTVVARRLSAEKGYPYLSSDEVNEGLRPLIAQDFHQLSPIANELTWFLARKQLRNGVSCIVDTNMCKPRSWKSLDAVIQEFPDVQVLPIILQCSLETHRQRIEHRGVTQSEHLNLGGDVLEDVLHKYEFINALDRPDLIRINAESSAEEVYQKVKEAIAAV